MTRNRATFALATVATAAASAAFLVPAGAANAAVVKGLQDQEMTINHPDLTSSFLTNVQEAKVGMVRFNTGWDGKSTVPPPWQVNGIRRTVLQAQAAGTPIASIEVAPTVTGGSSFNPRGKKAGPTAASKISVSAYKTYIRSLAESLKDLPTTRYYTALNEPNWYRHIPKRGGATVYRKLHNTAYGEIKKVDPSAKVLFGELLPYGRPLSKNYPRGQSADAGAFVREVLGLKSNWKAKGKSSTYRIKADGVALHTYDFKANPNKKRKSRDQWTQANLGYAKAALKRAAKTKRIPSSAVNAIYLTEFAYKTKPKSSDTIPVSRASTYLKSAWSIAKKHKAKSFVWYQLRDPQSTGENWQSGLQNRTGGARQTWTTYKNLK